MKNDLSKRSDRVKMQELKYREMPDIVIKVICRYRAELFFKISRKTKLCRLFDAWTERMEKSNGVMQDEGSIDFGGVITDEKQTGSVTTVKEVARPDGTNSFGAPSRPPLQYIFTHNGRSIEPDQTPEDANMEEGDEILAVELMDLTESPGNQEWVSIE
jgi:hypothetical protein